MTADTGKPVEHNWEYGREHNGYSHLGIPPACLACAAEASQPGPCQCMTSFAAVSPMHPGHCCFFPASQECHPAEVTEWERQRDLRRRLR